MKNTNLGKQWYLISSKPKRDSVAEQHLFEQGYEVYRPLVSRLRKRSNKFIEVTESLFPGYIFISLDAKRDDWSPIRSTVGVNRIVSFGSQPALVPKGIINSIKEAEKSIGEKVINLDRFKAGDGVTMQSGAFKGIQSIFLNYNGKERAMILIKIMSAETKVTVPVVELERS